MPPVGHVTSMLPCVLAMDESKSKGLWAPWVVLPSESRIAVRKQARRDLTLANIARKIADDAYVELAGPKRRQNMMI